ncbi:MAG: hypothetical protein ACTSPN_02080 [Promethearchaeota archaeon]
MNKKNKKKQTIFDLNSLTSREFQAFLILLTFEGNKIPLLKTSIDLQFGHQSRTKGYDYINGLCKKGLVYKKNNIENGKKHVSIHVNKKVRSEYEKFIAPTLSNTKKIVRELIQDNLSTIKDFQKNREKFYKYTETIIEAVNELISTSSSSALKSKRFQKKINDLVWKYYNAEMLKSDIFSK